VLEYNYQPRHICLIHCMVHGMNLSFKIVSMFPSVSKVEDLIRETHAYFSRSPNFFLEFKHFADGVTDGIFFI